jgi:hypothetical protein
MGTAERHTIGLFEVAGQTRNACALWRDGRRGSVRAAATPGAALRWGADTAMKTNGTDTACARRTGTFAIDEQTDQSFEIVREDGFATAMASVSGAYSTAAILVLFWLLVDTWTRRNLVLGSLGFDAAALGKSTTFRLMAYVAIGGALGGAVDSLRELIAWHAEREAYGPRFIWRDVTLPLVGAALGLLVYVTVRSGAGVFDGDFSLTPKGGSAALSAFALAGLAGFSARQVFRWLDAQANRLFKVAKSNQIAVPDLQGKTLDEVKSQFEGWALHVGKVGQADDAANVGKVIKQSPTPGAVVAADTPVDLTLGADPKSGGTSSPAAPAQAPS